MPIETRISITREHFYQWFYDVLSSRGFNKAEAHLAARWATTAAAYEVETHGPRKLLHLLDEEMQRSGSCVPNVEHALVTKFHSIEIWDAKRKLGPAVATLAQAEAQRIAVAKGIGVVVVRNTNHFGWGGAYVLDTMATGFLAGNLCQGAIPIVTPIGGRESRLGSNAICVAMETYRSETPFFLWDSGTASTSWGTVQQALLRGKDIPTGCAVDRAGQPTVNPINAASLLPAGSLGNGLGMLIELIAAQVGAGDPKFRSCPEADLDEGESPTCVFIHFAVNLTIFNQLGFPLGRSRQENVAAMVNSLIGDNADARLPGFRKWRAWERSLGGQLLHFSEESIDAFINEVQRSGVSLPPNRLKRVQLEIDEVLIAGK